MHSKGYSEIFEKFPFAQYELYMEDGVPHILGEGSFSVVFEVQDRTRLKKHYAMQVNGLKKQTVSTTSFEELFRMQQSLQEQCENIVRFIDKKELEVKGEHLQFILMEKLEPVVKRDRQGTVSLFHANLSEETAFLQLVRDIGQAIHTAHVNNVLHRDIKLENIFWDERLQCFKLGDFGAAKKTEKESAQTVIYSDGYGAPEIKYRKVQSYSAMSDIYSFGIVLYLILNHLCFPGSDGYYSTRVQYNEEFIFPAPEDATPEIARIIRKMCSYNIKDRYRNMYEVLEAFDRLRSEKTEDGKIECEASDLETLLYSQLPEEEDWEEDETYDILNRRYERRRHEERYSGRLIPHFLVMTLLFSLLFCTMAGNVSAYLSWDFLILPFLLLLEAFLLRLKDLYILFGAGCLAMTGYALIHLQGHMPQCVFLLCILLADSLILASAATGSLLWIGMELSGAFPVLHTGIFRVAKWFFLLGLCILIIRHLTLKKAFRQKT